MNAIPPDPDEQDWRLALQYLDGSLPAPEVAALNERLRRDPKLREVFTGLLVQQIQIAEIEQETAALAEEAAADQAPGNIIPLDADRLETLQTLTGEARYEDLPPVRRNAVPWIKRSPALSVLAAAAMLALTVYLVALFLQPARLASVTEVDGTVVVERGNRSFAATPGTLLRDGDRLVTTLNSRAAFAYLQEETHISLEASTRLGLSTINQAKHLRLSGGAIVADVAKQKPEAPLTLTTPQTEAIVVGTRFRLSTRDNSTRLAVYEGAVKVLQSEAGAEVLIESGKAIQVEPGVPALLVKLADTRGSALLEQLAADGSVAAQSYVDQLMNSGVAATSGGSRVRGYLHPPRSGAFSLHLTSPGAAELWLAEAAVPTSLRRVAGNQEGQPANAVVQLAGQQAHYFEVRLLTTNSAPDFTLSWTQPGGVRQVVSGDYLSPFDPTAAH